MTRLTLMRELSSGRSRLARLGRRRACLSTVVILHFVVVGGCLRWVDTLRMSGIEPGLTDRTEVERRFGEEDTGVRIDGLFFARGGVSSESLFLPLNLIVEFDAADRVVSHRRFTDDNLFQELLKLSEEAAQSPGEHGPFRAHVFPVPESGYWLGRDSYGLSLALNLATESKCLVIDAGRFELLALKPTQPLADGELEFEKIEDDPNKNVVLPLGSLRRLSPLQADRQPAASKWVGVSMLFELQTGFSEQLSLAIKMDDLRLLLQYLVRLRQEIELY